MKIKSLDSLNSFAKNIGNEIGKTGNILLFGDIGVGKTTFTRLLINDLQKKNKLKLQKF